MFEFALRRRASYTLSETLMLRRGRRRVSDIPKKQQNRLRLERLEERAMLAVAITGMPDWLDQGPGPTLNGQVENIPSPSPLGNDPVTGAVHTVLAHPTDPDRMWLGSVNGGIWRTDSATFSPTDGSDNDGDTFIDEPDEVVTWEPLTDLFSSLSISTLEFDISDATFNTIVAGIGAYSSFGSLSGPLLGLLRTFDGGDTWEHLGNSVRATFGTPGGLEGTSVSGLAVNGNSILVGTSNRGAGAGLYQSLDGGATFEFVSGTNGFGTGQVLDVVADPGDPNRVYASIGGVGGGVFTTDDFGGSWTDVTDPTMAALIDNTTNNLEIAVSPAAPNPVYAGIINNGQLRGIFRSPDQGANWTQMDTPQVISATIAINSVSGLATTPITITANNHGLTNNEQPQVRISGVTGNTAANGDWFVTVVDANNFTLNGSVPNGNYTGGGNWQKITGIQPRPKPGSQGNTHFSIAADPTNPNVVYVGGDRQDFPNPLGATTFSGRLFRGDATIAPGGPGAIPSPQWTPLTHTGTASASSPHADSRQIVFDPAGDLIEVDDGGIYRRTDPLTNTGDWFSLIGNLQVTELHDVTYDNISNIIIGGAQDTGTPQQFAPGSLTWDSVSTADGGDVAVDTLVGGGISVRYSSTQNLGGVRRRSYDAAGNFVAGSDVPLALNLVGPGTPITQGAAGNVQFVTPLATNNVAGGRLIIGGANNVWESTDLGANVSEVFAAGNVSVGVNRVAIDYGGTSGGVPNPDVLYLGSGSQVFVRTTAGGNLTATSPPGAGAIRDVIMHPDDWNTAYAIDADSVFMTTDAGGTWVNITGDLSVGDLRTIEVVAGVGIDALLVGSESGIFRMLSTAPESWSEYGAGLPNALVYDADYDPVDDVLVVGTMGRGAWMVPSVTSTVFDDSVLIIDGDEDYPGQDDVFLLIRDENNPLLLNVFINGVQQFNAGQPFQLDTLQQINVNGLGGNDTLIVDSSNGLIDVDRGIRFDGGIGTDRVELQQTGGDTHVSSTLTVGATPGAGLSVVVGAGATQSVQFENLEPFVDGLPATDLFINGAVVGSLLNRDNAINYSSSDLLGPTWGKVTVDNFEPIHFTNKVNLHIDAEAGSDTIHLGNPNVPTALTDILIDGGHPVAGSDTLIVAGTPGNDAITYTPTGLDGGTVEIVGLPTVDFSGTELLVIDGQSGLASGDALEIDTANIDGTQVLTPGSTFDSGTVDFRDGGFLLATAVSLQFQGLGQNGSLEFSDVLRLDDLIYRGTAGGDEFGVNTAGVVTLNTQIPVTTTAISTLILSGLDGDDVFTIAADHNLPNIVVEGGGEDADRLVFNGTAAAESFHLFANTADPSRVTLARDLSVSALDVVGIEEIDLNAGGEADIVNVGRSDAAGNPLSTLQTTDVKIVDVDLGPLGDADSVAVDGLALADELLVSNAAGVISLLGLPYDVKVRGSAVADGDLLTVRGNEGDDRIQTHNPSDPPGGLTVEEVIGITFDGGDGDDFLSADAILLGGPGDDFLQGGVGDDQLSGGAGEDTMIGGGGQDTYDGGAGFDTILIRGTAAADLIEVRQSDAATLEYTVVDQFGTIIEDATVASGTEDVIANVEQARVEAGDGSDTIRLAISDTLHEDAAINSLRLAADGGDGGGSDRLAVVDVDTADLSILRQSFDGRSGSVEIAPALVAPSEAFLHLFSGIEYVQVVADALAATAPVNVEDPAIANRLVVFRDDAGELNNDRHNATHLGAGPTVAISPTIDPGPGAFALPGDSDWFRFEAMVTGTIDFQILFTQIAAVGARPGLPGNGDLNITAYDSTGAPIAGFTTSDDDTDNERVRIPAVQGEIYYFEVEGDVGAINAFNVTALNLPAVTPFDLELDDQPVGDPPPLNSDTGRSQHDNITRDDTPTIIFRLDDAFFLNDLPGNDTAGTPFGDAAIPIPFQPGPAPAAAGYAIAIFDEGDTPGGGAVEEPQTPLGFATQIEPGVYQFTTPALAEGSHFLTARVQIIDPTAAAATGFGPRSGSLEIVVDTTIPPVSLGQPGNPDDGVLPHGDTGVSPPNPHTIFDNITKDTAPTFWGRAEADTIIRMYADVNGNGTFEIGVDVFLGQGTATPLDGTDQEPDGYWEIRSVVDLNDPAFFPVPNGLRTIFVTAEDVAGNVNALVGAADVLEIFVDTSGPVVDSVFLTDFPAYDLFDPKPLTDGPTPRVDTITIEISDFPERLAPGFLYDALKQDVAEQVGHYRLWGDHNGLIPIEEVIVTNLVAVDGQPARATVELRFAQPLPDDRFTLTISDSISDPVGNALDGENNAVEPQEAPLFSTGDGIPGGAFNARFTVDSRPEFGTISQGTVYVDINGNFVFDSDGKDGDHTNRDFVYDFGEISDAHFAGDFAPAAAVTSSGFAKLGVYGQFNGTYQFFLDTDDDGVGDFVSLMPFSFQTNAIPVAGNFSAAHPGDEIGAFDGQNWYLDVNGNNQINNNERFPTPMRGLPLVGDFNGDGDDDLATYNNDTGRFYFDLDGNPATIEQSWDAGFAGFGGFSGFGEIPVAGDFNLDGIDDIVMWTPGRDGQLPKDSGEYMMLISDRIAALPSNVFDSYSPSPLGNDLFAQFGDDFGLPIFGNFDPPVQPDTSGGPLLSLTNLSNPIDVDGNGLVSPLDALRVINYLNRGSEGELSPTPRTLATLGDFRPDTSGDGHIGPIDALRVINFLNRQATGREGEASNESWAEQVDALYEDDEESLAGFWIEEELERLRG